MKKWSQTDRAEMETLVKKVDEFISSFLGHFKVYQKHAFTAKNSPISKGKKGNLKEGEVLAVCDFAENYSLVVQDEIQSFRWNNIMVTIHPLIAYYK